MSNDQRSLEMTITDLERQSGEDRRNIHFYIKEGLLPAPAVKGGGARYYEEHLLRLRLIRIMQQSHLKLSGIREQLAGMTPEDMKDLWDRHSKLMSPGPRMGKAELAAYLEGKKFPSQRSIAAADSTKPTEYGFSFLEITKGGEQGRPDKEAVKDYVLSSSLKRTTPQARSTWERIEIVEGVEVLLRSDLASKYGHIIEELVSRIRRKPDHGRGK